MSTYRKLSAALNRIGYDCDIRSQNGLLKFLKESASDPDFIKEIQSDLDNKVIATIIFGKVFNYFQALIED